jgi:putative nucleotidyltransferase with HDIG domain
MATSEPTNPHSLDPDAIPGSAAGSWLDQPGGPALPARHTPAWRRLRPDPQWLVRRPGTVTNLFVLIALGLALGGVLWWSQPRVKLAPGQVMPETVVVRVGFERVDAAGTESARQQARLRTPRVYQADLAALDALRSSIENLPRALADASALSDVDPAIQAQFNLSPAALEAIKRQVDNGQPSAWWLERAARVDRHFRLTPVVDANTYQLETLAANDRVELRVGERSEFVPTGDVLNAESPALGDELRSIGALAGLEGELLNAVTSRLRHQLNPAAGVLNPTFTFDEATTALRQTAAAAAVRPTTNAFAAGQLIAVRGEPVTPSKLDLLVAERTAYWLRGDRSILAGEQLSIWAVGALGSLGLGAFAAAFTPVVWRSPRRLAALAALVTVAFAAAVVTCVVSPWLSAGALTIPALVVAMVLTVAYDRGTGLAIGSLVGILVCIALEQPVLAVGPALCGVWVGVWRMGDVRRRLRLVQAGAFTGLALALTVLVLAGMQRPLSEVAMEQTSWEMLIVAAGAMLTAFVVLGSLPLVERAFGVTTALTLVELRDPGHPLMRLLQQRAAGTYNHSLNVAAIAEAAAEAINADSLLTYVGAMYHDVGKMAKPEYFVENQAGGPNKHDKLTPAASLLVIVGHVQEGLLLARQFALPKCLHHFIEAHHGTTLVEYFFHRARKQAEAGGPLAAGPIPQEIEYRYPGPKPRTREAAILMIADAAESATRTLTDPTPPRIESLVRAIAHKRLMDGQFDQCDLTLRDVAQVVESLARSLAAIHHQRIAYPTAPTPKPAATPAPTSSPAPVAVRA